MVQKIRPAIEAGQVVVSDRFVDSSLAYQGAGRELGVEAVADLNDWATEGMVPDLTVLLDVAPAISKARREARDLGAPGTASSLQRRRSTHGLGTRSWAGPPRRRSAIWCWMGRFPHLRCTRGSARRWSRC